MSKDSYLAKKLDYQLQIKDGKIKVKPLNDYTNIFFKSQWIETLNQLFQQDQIQKVGDNFILFKQKFLYKDLKNFMQVIGHKLQNIRYCSSWQICSKGLQNSIDKVFNIKISVPGKQSNEEKKPYKDFIISYDILELIQDNDEESQIFFDENDQGRIIKPVRRTVIKRGKYQHFSKINEVGLKFPKVQFLIFYLKENHSKIKQVLSNLEQNRQQWLLYPINPYLDQFSLDKIYYQELIQKILIKRYSHLQKICEGFGFQMLDKKAKLLKDEMINRNRSDPDHPDLQNGYYIGFHIFGQAKHFYQFFIQINQFFQDKRMWILRPQKICCCQSLANLEDMLKQQQGLDSYLISDHIVVIIKSQKDVNLLTSIKHRQLLNQSHQLSDQDRILQLLQTGQFVLDINDYDQQDLQYIYKQRQKYREYLQRKHRIKVSYKPSNKRRISIVCQIAAFRIFKGSIYTFISDYKEQKQQLRQFNTPFNLYVFENFLRKDLEAQFPQVKFYNKKKKNIERIWVKFNAKDRSQLMEKLNELMKKFELNMDYIVCRKQPIAQNWFALYRRPHILSIQTLTCRKYIISRQTKVYVQPYQSLSRTVEEMLFLIDHSFQNCWEFVEIAEQNDVNLMSLFLEFQQKKTKKPDRIKSIPLTNHRYINKMALWYNDMLKKIQSRREQDIKKLYKRYQDKRQMHIMIPRHATSNILLHFVLPSFVKEFTQQAGYDLKQIYFYYPILFDQEHRHVENQTLKVIDEQMKRANIELQNQNYLTHQSIKKISQMEYLTLHCTFQGDQRIWKASNMSSYVFFIERQILVKRKTQLSKSVNAQIRKKILNFKIPLFFMDASFNNQIVVDLGQQWFYKIGKVTIQGPIEIKSDKKYDQIAKCIICIKNIFRSLSYVVLYVDKDFRVSKNGYYYSHKDYMSDLMKPLPQQLQPISFKKNKQKFVQMTFNAGNSLTDTFTKKQSNRMTPTNILPKIALNPMKLQIASSQNKNERFNESGKIIKRESKRLMIEIIQSEMLQWYMAQTCKQRLGELQQYLKNKSNYKNNQNFLLGDISEYSILDLKQEQQISKFLDFQNQVSQDGASIVKYQQQILKQNNNNFSMDEIDLSVIYSGNQNKQEQSTYSQNKISFLQQLNTSDINNMSMYSAGE